MLTTNWPLGCPGGSVITALLPTSPLTVGIGEAEATGLGTAGAELVGAGEGPLFTGELLLQAASTSIGRTTSRPAVRRTGFLTVGRAGSSRNGTSSTTLGADHEG
ncbi:hypothetical protein GCM10009665_06170 [Kitasatospora nipponensis]|uniref:Uncharacterized protein n=1 Tax=Kitasatospora nipponensis TaxID=258049 RepID=A0ABN1VP91_9ACTN